ncbi:MAG TPA: helix-turn-helix domain-containing protein [Cyclobacteriaceae bacterium]
MEQGIYFTGISKAEFKNLLKETLIEILQEGKNCLSDNPIPDILDVKQAADFIKAKITTLYEKTSTRAIPHFKKGNRLYFKREELEAWIQKGKVQTREELQREAITYSFNRSARIKK